MKKADYPRVPDDIRFDDVAELLGLTTQTVRNYIGNGYMTRGALPSTVAKAAIPEYINKLKQGRKIKSGIMEVEGETPKERLDRLRGDQVELGVMEKRGELLQAGRVESDTIEFAKMTIEGLKRITPRLEQDYGLEPEICQQIDQAIGQQCLSIVNTVRSRFGKRIKDGD